MPARSMAQLKQANAHCHENAVFSHSKEGVNVDILPLRQVPPCAVVVLPVKCCSTRMAQASTAELLEGAPAPRWLRCAQAIPAGRWLQFGDGPWPVGVPSKAADGRGLGRGRPARVGGARIV